MTKGFVWPPNAGKLRRINEGLTSLSSEYTSHYMFKYLVGIDLSFNELHELPNVESCKKLAYVNLELNKFSVFPSALLSCPIISLNLGQNKLTLIPPDINRLRELKALRLKCNQLTELPIGLGELKQLEWLDVSWNELTVFPYAVIERLPNLKHLNLSDNYFSDYPKRRGGLEISKEGSRGIYI
jgi:Leucine-rich repeat (LRR) protein